MTDPRPRPKYGEYAPLPIAAPSHPSDGAVDSQSSDASVTPQQPAPPVAPRDLGSASSTHRPDAAQPHFANTANAAIAPERKRRMWDVLLTSTLLLFGVVDVINTFSTVSNLGPALREGLAGQGVESFSSEALAAEAGGAANIVRLVVLVLAIVFSLIQIQRKRIAFWIPIVGAVIAGIALVVAILVTVMSDPGFMAYVDGLQQQP
ncbi:DUF6264 family protein [Salinibacterium sp. TMP30]|uniref:DUF6264 family protein n=1 Tax=Salinibacterium sp. TMP30 TaxID=3138237 RepID=UPI0031389311